MATPAPCPKCGRPVAENAVAGLCPACLLQAGLDATSYRTGPFDPKFTAPSLAELAPHFPQLELIEQLGQGGMGAVYKARQSRLDRPVALKILPKDAGPDGEFANRFAREARALARLSHPNIVTIHDYGEAGGWFFFVMEFVDGVNLRHAIQAKTFEPKDALAVISQICDALQYAHDEGIVHRDIKPENILLDKRGRVKIADFGLAKLLGQTAAGRLTQTHQVMGTLGYMAPEQMQGTREVDHRADLYALGVVFYELLTGELPMGRFAPPSQKVQVDVRIDEVVLKTLEREPDRRYQFASQIKQDVERITGRNAPAPAVAAPWWQGTTGAGLALLLTGIFCGILLIIGLLDVSERSGSNNWRHDAFLFLSVVDLLCGLTGVVSGALMLSHRLWAVVTTGAFLCLLPLAPVAFVIKPEYQDANTGLQQLLQIAQTQGIKLSPTREERERESSEAWTLRHNISRLMEQVSRSPNPPFLGRPLILVVSLAHLGVGLWALIVLFRPANRALFRTTIPDLLRGAGQLLYKCLANTTTVALVLCGLGLLGCINWAGLYGYSTTRPLPLRTEFPATATWHGQAVVALLGVTLLANFLSLGARTRGAWLGITGLACCLLMLQYTNDIQEALPELILGLNNTSGDVFSRVLRSDLLSFSHALSAGFTLTIIAAIGLVFTGAAVLSTARRSDVRPATPSDGSPDGTALTGMLGVILFGLGAGFMTWVMTAVLRHDTVRIPLVGQTTSPLPWLVTGGVLATGGLGLLVALLRGRRGPLPYPALFGTSAALFLTLATALAAMVWVTLEREEPLWKTFRNLIDSPSEAIGWIAGLATGGLVSLLLALWPIRLTRRFWITLYVLLIILVLLAMFLFPTTVEITYPPAEEPAIPRMEVPPTRLPMP